MLYCAIWAEAWLSDLGFCLIMAVTGVWIKQRLHPLRAGRIRSVTQLKMETATMRKQRNGIRRLAVLLLGSILLGSVSEGAAGKIPVPVIHVTDLYRPHCDPDDHWDLACVFALAHRGAIDLKAVVIDYPQVGRPERNPDVAAVAQMNRITHLAVPVVAGCPLPMKSRNDTQPNATSSDHHAAETVLRLLHSAERPVVIHVIGCCRDIALAGKKAPDLFARKCAGIYLNAGTGLPGTKLEWNVSLGRAAYAAIFDLPCPIYWMPCFEGKVPADRPEKRGFGTHYVFRQGEILPHLSARAQNYFLYMLGRYTDQNWLGYLEQKPDDKLLAEFSAKDRNMWCTGGFLYCAGYTATPDGKIVPRDKAGGAPVFTFDPIAVTCDDNGHTAWRPDPKSKNRFIFHVRDAQNYPTAMTIAMKSLLSKLP